MINAGADINTQNIDKKTPLSQAIKTQRIDMIKYLISIGADTSNLSEDEQKQINEL